MAACKDGYDVIVIGAGIAGAAAARELSRYDLSVAVLEKEADVSFGTTKGSHAIVHCGLPAPGAPLRSRGELEGNLMMEEICRQLSVPFKRIGKLLVAFDARERRALKKIRDDAVANGVAGTELIEDRQRLQAMEPQLSEAVVAALYSPSTGVTNPWGLTIGLIENARENGAELHLNARVEAVRKTVAGDFVIETTAGAFRAGYVINAAGIHADKIARMVGDDSFHLMGLRMQRIIMDKACDGRVNHLVRALDGESPVGDFVCPTVDGNVMLGCAVDEVADLEDDRTTAEGLNGWVVANCLKLIPGLEPQEGIKPFCGVIPMAGAEFHIQPVPDAPGFVHLVLGASGFTASVAMARHLVQKVMPAVGMKLEQRTDFNPLRKAKPSIHTLDDRQYARQIAEDPLYGRIACRCETVSEGEIVAAVRSGATTRDGVKFRTRAGMGRCQSNFCGHKVLDIMRRELGVTADKITRNGSGSEEVYPAIPKRK